MGSYLLGNNTNTTRTAAELQARGANNLMYAMTSNPNSSYSQALGKVSDAFSGMNNGSTLQNSWSNYLAQGNYTPESLQNWSANNVFGVQNGNYNQTLSNWLGIGQLGVGLLSGLGSYFNGKSYLNLAKQQLAQQENQFNETFNQSLKERNAADADRISNRALYATGNSHAYDDEIAANAYARGHTGTDSSEDNYLAYKRSANA